MRAKAAWSTTLTYAMAAVLCVALPFAVPAQHERVAMTIALFLGAPLAGVAVLLALLHIALGLQARSDWLIALAFASASVLSIQPVAYWWPDLGSALARVGLAALAAASGALVWLALRTWRAPSPARHVLGIGVALVAARLAASAYQAVVAPSSGMEAVAASMSAFLLDTSVAALVLLLGLLGHWRLAPRANRV